MTLRTPHIERPDSLLAGLLLAALLVTPSTALPQANCPIKVDHLAPCSGLNNCAQLCQSGQLQDLTTGVFYQPTSCGTGCAAFQCDPSNGWALTAGFRAPCDGTPMSIHPDPVFAACLCTDMTWFMAHSPELFDVPLSCSRSTPAEVCGNGIDENCNSLADEGCSEICGNGLDDNANLQVDEGCEPTLPPDLEATRADPVSEMNQGCSVGDWAGRDPIALATKAVVTEPFTDFEVAHLRPLGLVRTYSSGDALATPAVAGIFGIGWHHNWEATLSCSGNGNTCSVSGGLVPTMAFAYRASLAGRGALAGEHVGYYTRSETAPGFGGREILVRRPNGEFILYKTDGSEQRFGPSVSGNCPYCMDVQLNGKLRLTSDTDPKGQTVRLDFTTAGTLLTIRDDLDNLVSIKPSSACPARAGLLSYRLGAAGTDVDYLRYEYDAACATLSWVKPTDTGWYAPRPGAPAVLAGYTYSSTPRTGLLLKILNEARGTMVEFDYDPATGDARFVRDATSTVNVYYPQLGRDVSKSLYGASYSLSTLTTDRAVGGKASRASYSIPNDQNGPRNPAYKWNGRFLVCSEDEHHLRYFFRDSNNRVTEVLDLLAPWRGGTYSCASSSPPSRSLALRRTLFEYGLTKPIASSVALGLDRPTRTWRRSVFNEVLSGPPDPATIQYEASESLDYSPLRNADDPAWYSCGPSTLPVGAMLCRRVLEGYTKSENGEIVHQRIITRYSYDSNGRLVLEHGPTVIEGPSPSFTVDPVQTREYWPAGASDPALRGRLMAIKKWPSGWPDEAKALTTSLEAYDTFGPTIVIDSAGGSTTLSRVGGGGRVTRLDTPDGRSLRIRYHHVDKPRLILLNGGSALRLVYRDFDQYGGVDRISGDPEAPGAVVTVGWSERRLHDLAGNVTRRTFADSMGVVRWQQDLDYDAFHQVKTATHPEPGRGSATWWFDMQSPGPVSIDEDGRTTSAQLDGLGRPTNLGLRLPFSSGNGYLNEPIVSYVYEPDQDAIRSVHAPFPGGVVAEYVHDDFGRTLSVNAPSTFKQGAYAYLQDARGNVVKRTGGGRTLEFHYDGLDRLTTLIATRDIDGAIIAYGYQYDDPAGVAKPTGSGRLLTTSEPLRTTTFTWDEVGRLRYEQVAEVGVLTALTTEYRYDADGDLFEVVSPGGLTVRYVRDPVTKEVTEVRNVTSGTKYAYDIKHRPQGPITNFTFAGGATLASDFNLRYEPSAISSGPVAMSYEMYASGNVKVAGTMEYQYDLHGRLSLATPAAGSIPASAPTYTPRTYVYSGGDRVIEAWSIGPDSRRLFAFGYDAASNLSAISDYNASGTNIVRTTCFVHDALGRLTAVGTPYSWVGPDGTGCQAESQLSSVQVRFAYDAQNRRIAKQVGNGPWKFWSFLPDGSPLAEFWKPTFSSGAWTVDREYVWLDGRPLAQVEYPGPAGGSEGYIFLAHVDHLGRPLAYTSTTGATVWTAQYPRPDGSTTSDLSSPVLNGKQVSFNLRLPGQYHEGALHSASLPGPYYNGHRWYLPELGRYMEPDPIAVAGGFNGAHGPDWYHYARSNPPTFIDPSGLDIEVVVWHPVLVPLASIAGHVSVTVNGTSYSWEMSGMQDPLPWDIYRKQNTLYRPGTGYKFRTTPDQDDRALWTLNRANNQYCIRGERGNTCYFLSTQNCGQVAQRALTSAGLWPLGVELKTPLGLGTALSKLPGVVITRYPINPYQR